MTVVYPVISYGAGIWGCKSYSCINAVQNRAMRFFLGVGKYTPVAALEGEMGWEPSFIKQWTCTGRHFVRISCTPLNRINKRIALWAHSKASPKCKNWFYSIKECLLKLHLMTDYDINRPLGTEFVNNLQEAGLNEFKTSWFNSVHSAVGPSGRGRNKLRTYCLFKRPNHIALTLCLYVTAQPSPSSAVQSHHSESKRLDMRINLLRNVKAPSVMK